MGCSSFFAFSALLRLIFNECCEFGETSAASLPRFSLKLEGEKVKALVRLL